MMTNEELESFEKGLQEELMKLAKSFGMLGSFFLETEDIDVKWKEFAPEYLAEAVKNVNDYPEFAVACAAYAGMATAHWWDEDWGRHHSSKFADLLGPRGFDDMDDYIVTRIMGFPLDSAEAGTMKSTIELLSQQTWAYIRRSGVERATADAYAALARACRALFRVGAAMELKRLGYNYQAVALPGRPS